MQIPRLVDPTVARLSVVPVNLRLGFPYLFLITLGALQSILITSGNPPTAGAATPVGHTDILVSYTDRIAFGAGGGMTAGCRRGHDHLPDGGRDQRVRVPVPPAARGGPPISLPRDTEVVAR